MKLLLAIDRLAFWLFFRWYYRRIFAEYGNNVRWGRGFRRLVIPATVRVSRPDKIRIGDDCKIDEGVYLQCHDDGEGIVLGRQSRINAHTHILAYSKIEIGPCALVAPFVLMASGDHGHEAPDVAIMHQPYRRSGEIVLGEGAWVGHGAKILGGAVVGRYSVVAAGAVVKQAFADSSILAGVPARCVRRIAAR